MEDGKQIEREVLAVVERAAPRRIVVGKGATKLFLRSDLGLDSLALLTLVYDVAQALGLDPDDFVEAMDEPFRTVAELVSLSTKVMRGAARS
jgi:acyl carrier protein